MKLRLGISHITFLVRDLDRMATFLCDGLGVREVYDGARHNYSLSREKFFLRGGDGLAAMGDSRATRIGADHFSRDFPPTPRAVTHLRTGYRCREITDQLVLFRGDVDRKSDMNRSRTTLYDQHPPLRQRLMER